MPEKYGLCRAFSTIFFALLASRSYPVPVDLLGSGTVPATSGLSSSAAIVVASTLAFLTANDNFEGVTEVTLVEMAMENENRVGVNSRGYAVLRYSAFVVIY